MLNCLLYCIICCSEKHARHIIWFWYRNYWRCNSIKRNRDLNCLKIWKQKNHISRWNSKTARTKGWIEQKFKILQIFIWKTL